MGHVYVDAELSWVHSERVRLLVDTGATYTLLPEDLVERLGVARSPRPVGVTLADGSERNFQLGTVLVRLEQREAGATVLIAPVGSEPLLGVEALEALGLAVDPNTHTLLPTRAHAVLAVGLRPPLGATADDPPRRRH
jgi:clan AA aspartic protease